jgi:hypothetical protein
MVRRTSLLSQFLIGRSPSWLSALLEAHWPGAKAIFADVESPIDQIASNGYRLTWMAAKPLFGLRR